MYLYSFTVLGVNCRLVYTSSPTRNLVVFLVYTSCTSSALQKVLRKRNIIYSELRIIVFSLLVV